MSELIVELASRAGYDPEVFAICRPGMEKFALEIVRECIRIIDNEQPGYQDYRSQIEVMMRNDCAKALEYKFGLPINDRF
jgi:hypothetical protein